MSQEPTEFNAPTSVDWGKIAREFFGFAKAKPFAAFCIFTVGCITLTVCAVKAHPSTKAEAIIASN